MEVDLERKIIAPILVFVAVPASLITLNNTNLTSFANNASNIFCYLDYTIPLMKRHLLKMW